MTQFEPPHNDLPRTNWQSLGQLKMVAGSILEGTISGWLINALADYSLPNDLTERLLASIQEAKKRVLSPDGTEGQFDYLEIAVLAPAGQTSKRHTWGFFRVERAATDPLNKRAKGHCIDFYLYLDK